jgi:hypothetical protein
MRMSVDLFSLASVDAAVARLAAMRDELAEDGGGARGARGGRERLRSTRRELSTSCPNCEVPAFAAPQAASARVPTGPDHVVARG